MQPNQLALDREYYATLKNYPCTLRHLAGG